MFLAKGLIAQVGYVNRFNDMFATAREYVRGGLIGDVIRFKSEMYSSTITKPESGDSWRSKERTAVEPPTKWQYMHLTWLITSLAFPIKSSARA